MNASGSDDLSSPQSTPQPNWRLDPRVELAAERTLLAWIRTGLALMGFGFVVARFGLFLRELAAVGDFKAPPGRSGSLIVGVGLVGMGVWVILVAAYRFRNYIAALSAGKDIPPPGAAYGIFVSLALAVFGVIMVVYLLSIAS
jgi:putative membrane protein